MRAQWALIRANRLLACLRTVIIICLICKYGSFLGVGRTNSVIIQQYPSLIFSFLLYVNTPARLCIFAIYTYLRFKNPGKTRRVLLGSLIYRMCRVSFLYFVGMRMETVGEG